MTELRKASSLTIGLKLLARSVCTTNGKYLGDQKRLKITKAREHILSMLLIQFPKSCGGFLWHHLWGPGVGEVNEGIKDRGMMTG